MNLLPMIFPPFHYLHSMLHSPHKHDFLTKSFGPVLEIPLPINIDTENRFLWRHLVGLFLVSVFCESLDFVKAAVSDTIMVRHLNTFDSTSCYF